MRNLSFSETEMQLMKDEFINRFCDRLNRYRKGRKLMYMDEGNYNVGFRWER